MHRLKQGMAAVALVATLGFVVPGFVRRIRVGGPGAGPRQHRGAEVVLLRPRYQDGTIQETPYHVVSTDNDNGSFHDLVVPPYSRTRTT